MKCIKQADTVDIIPYDGENTRRQDAGIPMLKFLSLVLMMLGRSQLEQRRINNSMDTSERSRHIACLVFAHRRNLLEVG
jgi:hypothetical protein